MKILIIEDEPKVASVIQQTLKEYNLESDIATNGLEGERLALSNQYDLIILDLILPLMNGIEVCKAIRRENNRIPILMLTALNSTDDIVRGFDAGADDYLSKPFEVKELIARVKALGRRSAELSENQRILKVSNLELNLDRKNVKRNGDSIDLTTKEFLLLEFFVRNSGKVLSRNEIARKVWDIDFDTGTNIVDVYVNFLRKKIDKKYEPKLIHTMIGSGYYFGDK